jgi:hypothetical protein
MRFLVLSVSALCVTCLGATCALAQPAQWGQAGDQIPPYPTHVDRRHGNNHVYPDRGAVVRDLPHGAAGINYAGISYRFAGGVWYEPLGPAYIVVEPPIGVVVPQLPAFATGFDRGGKSFLYANDVFYRARPDLGGYEVVNDPQDDIALQSQALVAPPLPPAAFAAPAEAQLPPQSAAAPAAQPENVAAPPAAPMAPPVTSAVQMTVAAVPAGVSPTPANPTKIVIQPRNGQGADQEAMDRYECYRFAVAQSGFDPLAVNGGSTPAEVAGHDSDYSRAQTACLEGRGYSIP